MKTKLLLIGGELNGLTLEQAMQRENERGGVVVQVPAPNGEALHPSGLPRFVGFMSLRVMYALDDWWFAPGVVGVFYGCVGCRIDEAIQQGQELLGWSLSTIKAEES